MTEAAKARWKRRIATVCFLSVGLPFSLYLETVEAYRTAGRGLLVACLLVVLALLSRKVREALRLQRPEPLEALSRTSRRYDVVPSELHRIRSEVRGARESRRFFAEGLGPRLERIHARRRGAASRPESGARAPGRPGRRLRERGMSAEEIGAEIDRIEES